MLALTAALVGPHFIDWTSYRADFEREATAVLGRRVTVEGDVTARLLPFPSVTFSNVVVAGDRPEEPAMTAETFSMDAELAPFLRGDVLIFDMRLERPSATIDIDVDGTVDWAVRPSSPFDAAQISLERLTVTDGRIVLRHAASGRTHVLDDIEASISARSFAGPWRADGSLVADGMPAKLAMSTGVVDAEGTMRLRLRVEPKDRPLVLEADGDTRLIKGSLNYSGGFRLGLGEPAAQPAGTSADNARQARDGPRPYRTTGRFDFGHQRLEVSEFRFETGPLDDPYTADGSAFLELGSTPRFGIDANGAQVRLSGSADPAKGEADLAQRLSALGVLFAGVPKPTIPGSLEIRLPALVAGDTTVRDLHVSADTESDGWAIKSFSATLPGRTTLEASGALRTERETSFDGQLLLAVAQPSGFAAWLSKDVDEAVRRLPGAGFRAHALLTASRQRFSDLELILGKAHFKGEIERLAPADARPSVTVGLAGGALDVDGARAFASLFVSDDGRNRVTDQDLTIDLKAGPVSAAGLSAATLDTALRLRDDTLEIDRLSIGDLEGATIGATGTIKGFPEAPSGKTDFSIVAVDLAPLIAVLAERIPAVGLAPALDRRARALPGLFADTNIDVVASAAPNGDAGGTFSLTADGVSGGSTISLKASANGNPAAPGDASVKVDFSARNENAEALLGLLGAPTLPLGALPGGEATLSLDGTLAGGLETRLALTGEGFAARFDGRATAWADNFTATGPAHLDAGDIEPWLMTTGFGLPGMGFGLPLALDADLDYRDGSLSLRDLRGTVEDGAVSGDLDVVAREGVPHFTGKLALDALELGPVAALLLGEPALESKAGWPAVPFQEKPAPPFSADIALSAATLSVAGLAEAGEATATARLDGDGLILSDFSGKAYDGRVTGLFELKNSDGTGVFSSQIKLDDVDLETALPDAGLAGRGNLSASLTASGKSLEAMAADLSGSGTVSLAGLAIAGVEANALPALIAAADKIGRDIDSARTAEFAPPIVGAGRFAPKDAEFAFSVAGGIVRAPPLRLVADGATLTAELRVDLRTGEVSIAQAIDYDPGDERLVGSDPTVRMTVEGVPGTTRRRFDTEPLAQYLTQRALEREQARVEAMQAELLERQRLRREVRYFAALEEDRRRVAEELRRADDALRQKAEEERRRRQEEAARRKAAEEAAKAQADAEAKAEEAARQEAAEEAAKAAAAAKPEADAQSDANAAAEEAAKAQADAEAKAEEAARQEAAEEAAKAAAAAAKPAADAQSDANAAASAAAKAAADAVAKAQAERASRDEGEAARAAEQALDRARNDARRAADAAAARAAEAIEHAERERVRMDAGRKKPAAGLPGVDTAPLPKAKPDDGRTSTTPAEPRTFSIDSILKSLGN